MLTKFGLQIPSFTYPAVTDSELFERVSKIANVAEASGFDSIWVMDHLFQIPNVGRIDEPMFEAYTLLGALSARTTTASLGALVTGVTYRNPALLAKQVTTLDVLSAGRAILGIGAAWFEEEHSALGFEFPPLKERFERLEEALQITKSMFTGDAAPVFDGKYYKINGAINKPRPIRPTGIPVLIGGSGEKKTLRLVAQYADACNIFGDPSTVSEKLQVLSAHCEVLGRDPATITKTRIGTLVIAETKAQAERIANAYCGERQIDPQQFKTQATVGDADFVVEEVGRYLAAGLDGLIFNIPNAYDTDGVELAGKALRGAFGTL